jgi:hypothetical protein
MRERKTKGKARPKEAFFKKEPMGRALLVVPPTNAQMPCMESFHTEKLET